MSTPRRADVVARGRAFLESLGEPVGPKRLIADLVAEVELLREWAQTIVVDRALVCQHGVNVPGQFYVLRRADQERSCLGYVEAARADEIKPR